MQTIKAGCASNLLMINILLPTSTLPSRTLDDVMMTRRRTLNLQNEFNFCCFRKVVFTTGKCFFVDGKCVFVVFTFVLLLYMNNRHGSGSKPIPLRIYRLNSLLSQS